MRISNSRNGNRGNRIMRIRHHELPKCPMTGKVRYRDQTQAQDGLASARWRGQAADYAGLSHNRREVRVYLCACGGWHATSQPIAVTTDDKAA